VSVEDAVAAILTLLSDASPPRGGTSEASS
jgi:hypothetical protein